MKIKTITDVLPFSNRFDDRVNDAMGDGWRLVKREVIPAGSNPDSHRLLYAELVELDPVPEVPEPQPVDPCVAIRILRDTCEAVPVADCGSDRCPLYAWCEGLRKGGDPTDWVIPGEVLET